MKSSRFFLFLLAGTSGAHAFLAPSSPTRTTSSTALSLFGRGKKKKSEEVKVLAPSNPTQTTSSTALSLFGRGKKKKSEAEAEAAEAEAINAAIQEWKKKYATVEGYRKRHGVCRNLPCIGDWGKELTRVYYHLLLLEAMIALEKIGPPDELKGILAHEARLAVKCYVRERSQIQWRIFAESFDGFRQLVLTKRWNIYGKTYEQLYNEKMPEVVAEAGGIDNLTQADLDRGISVKVYDSGFSSTNSMVNDLAFGDVFGMCLSKFVRFVKNNRVYLDTLSYLFTDCELSREHLQRKHPGCHKMIKIYQIKTSSD